MHGLRGDELLELVGVNFAKTFKAAHFGTGAQFFKGGIAFGFGIAVDVVFFVADAEERGFQNEHAAAGDQFFKIAQKEREHQVSDMEAVVIGIGCNDNL